MRQCLIALADGVQYGLVVAGGRVKKIP